MSYERLKFFGDAALGLAVASHFFRLEQQKLTPGQLTDLRKDSVKKYEEEVKQGDDQNITVTYPGILADIVESLAGAVYLDVNFNLTKLWMIFKDILEVDKIMLPKDGGDGSSEITGAQNELYGLCGKRKWENPVYSEVKVNRLKHEKKYVYSVEIGIADRVFSEEGDEKSSVKDAKNSAAYLMIRSLRYKNLI
ncbi:hypothetical protein CRYUN_Cryun39dG0017400 [Craigia yunnanensis]